MNVHISAADTHFSLLLRFFFVPNNQNIFINSERSRMDRWLSELRKAWYKQKTFLRRLLRKLTLKKLFILLN